MDPVLAVRVSAWLLAIGAVGGLAMAVIRFTSDRQPPPALSMLHGFLAAAAVTVLLYAAATVGLPGAALAALALLLLAAAGGVVMNLNYHWKNLPLPKGLLVGHAVAAVAGFVLLLSLALR